ncbi:MAG: GHKL domain-containing protein [Hespellia sp.]|nr:GHKL domain-containing protein [Hespellia sp.]
MLSHIDIHKMNALMEENADAKTIIQQLLENHQITISTIAHEIRNPLTLVSSSLQIIELQHPEVKDFDSWNQTIEDVTFMCQLLNELSTFNNGGTLRYNVFPLGRLLKNTAISFAMSLDNEKIEFKSLIDPTIGDYTGDKNKLNEVLLNLLKNAKEAINENMTPESPVGHISLEARRKHNGIMISISDNGCGIDPEKISDIFQPFHTTKADGTGLGLAISKRIIESHKGQLSVKSTPGKGSTFIIALPF